MQVTWDSEGNESYVANNERKIFEVLYLSDFHFLLTVIRQATGWKMGEGVNIFNILTSKLKKRVNQKLISSYTFLTQDTVG